jgi:hypothetical protein
VRILEVEMIELYRTADSAAGERVESALQELVVAHRVVTVAPEAPSPLNGTPLPAIVDGERVVSGDAALEGYLAELAQSLEQWRRYQADVCYLDDEGNVC